MLIDITAFDWLETAAGPALVAIDGEQSLSLHLFTPQSAAAASATAAGRGDVLADLHAVSTFAGGISTEIPSARLRQLLLRVGIDRPVASVVCAAVDRSRAYILVDGVELLVLTLSVTRTQLNLLRCHGLRS